MQIEKLNRYKDESLKGIQKVFDELERQSEESGIDEFNGHNRNDFIIKFDSYKIVLDKQGKKEWINVKVGIYLQDNENIWVGNLEPIGNYLTIYDFEGEFIDEFLTIESKYKNFGIDYWIEVLNNSIPKRYFKRNTPEYTLVSYINHSIFLFQGRDFDGVIIFLKRCLDYLIISENKERLEPEYLNNVNSYFQSMFYYIKNNNLIDSQKLEKYDIEKRLKTKS